MAELTIYRCDSCGAEKRSANHWLLILNGHGQFTLLPWEPEAARNCSMHLCGEACAVKMLQKWLGELSR